MKETVVKVDHCPAAIANKAGEGARILGALKDSGVNLIALWAYLSMPGKAQLEMIPENGAALVKAAKKVDSRDRQEADRILCERRGSAWSVVAESLGKLAAAKINVGAVLALCGGAGRYGAIIFIPQKDVRKAAKALGLA